MAKKAHPEKCHPKMVAAAKERAKDRQSAFSEYIRLRFQATGSLAPGCDARDFFAAYDQLVEQAKPVTAENKNEMNTT